MPMVPGGDTPLPLPPRGSPPQSALRNWGGGGCLGACGPWWGDFPHPHHRGPPQFTTGELWRGSDHFRLPPRHFPPPTTHGVGGCTAACKGTNPPHGSCPPPCHPRAPSACAPPSMCPACMVPPARLPSAAASVRGTAKHSAGLKPCCPPQKKGYSCPTPPSAPPIQLWFKHTPVPHPSAHLLSEEGQGPVGPPPPPCRGPLFGDRDPLRGVPSSPHLPNLGCYFEPPCCSSPYDTNGVGGVPEPPDPRGCLK